MNPKFYNKNGTLTAYALACGYIERKGEWELYRDGCFHVRKSNTQWFRIGTLTEARKIFAKVLRGVEFVECSECGIVAEDFRGDFCKDCDKQGGY